MSSLLDPFNGEWLFRRDFAARPIIVNNPQRVDQAAQAGRFGDVRIGAKTVSFTNIGFHVGAAVYNGGDDGILWIGPHPAEQVQATHFGHFEVGEQDVGDREFVAIRELVESLEVSDCLFTIPDGMETMARTASLDGPPHEDDVVLVVFDQ
jgi:hypothetical protein